MSFPVIYTNFFICLMIMHNITRITNVKIDGTLNDAAEFYYCNLFKSKNKIDTEISKVLILVSILFLHLISLIVAVCCLYFFACTYACTYPLFSFQNQNITPCPNSAIALSQESDT